MPEQATSDLCVAIVEYSSDALIFADRQGVIRLWNPSAQALFGFSAHEAIGQSLDLIIPERLRAAHWKGFDQALEGGRTKYGRRAMITRSIYVDMSFAITRDAAGQVVGSVAIARDASERHAADTALRTRVADLEAQLKVHSDKAPTASNACS
jgi:PAS domain S-box-containing protein